MIQKILYKALIIISIVSFISSCSKSDMDGISQEGTTNKREVSIKTKINTNLTKVEFEKDASGALKIKWEKGDAISVVYEKDGVLHNEKFTLSYMTSDDNSSAVFVNKESEIPESDITVSVYYPYVNTTDSENGKPEIDLLKRTEGNHTMANAAKNAVMCAANIALTDGEFTDAVHLEKQVSLIRIPAGTLILEGDREESTIHIGFKGLYYDADYTATGLNVKSLNYKEFRVNLYDGALVEDLYMPFFPAPSSTSSQLLSGRYLWVSPDNLSGLNATTGVIEESNSIRAYYYWDFPSRNLDLGKTYSITSLIDNAYVLVGDNDTKHWLLDNIEGVTNAPDRPIKLSELRSDKINNDLRYFFRDFPGKLFPESRFCTNLTKWDGCENWLNLEYVDCRNMKKLIGAAFLDQSIKTIELKEVEEIGDAAFLGCIKLETIVFYSIKNIITIGSNALGECKSLKSIYVPDVEEFKASIIYQKWSAENYTEFVLNDIIKPLSDLGL